MNITNAAILRRLELREDSSWEFKSVVFAGDEPKKPDREDWAIAISAFANAAGGTLLCGVTDEGELQQLSGDQLVSLDRLLVQISTDAIEPSIRISTHHLEPVPGRRILLVEVPRGRACHATRRGVYLRVGASNRKIGIEESRRIAWSRGFSTYFGKDAEGVPYTGFETLDERLWLPITGTEVDRKPEETMKQLGLLTEDDVQPRATVAGILFCANRPEQWLPHAIIKAVAYRGSDRFSEQLDARDIGGPLNQQVADAMDFVMKNMRVGARKVPEREDLPQYSKRATFEALVNAVAHRDYTRRGSTIRLSMFEDRVEIQSPGALPNGMTIENMSRRQATRNRVVAHVFGYMPARGIPGSEHRRFFMESRGQGVSMIRRYTQELCGSYPTYELPDDSDVRLTIPSLVVEDSAARVRISIRCEGKPVSGADLLVLYPHHLGERATTDDNGEAWVSLHSTHLPLTLFAAADGCRSFMKKNWFPNPIGLNIEMARMLEGGSVIFTEEKGRVPGLAGLLRATRDPYGRVRLAASNLTINDGQEQPVHVRLGRTVKLVDGFGAVFRLRVMETLGISTLFEYRDFEPHPTSHSIEERDEDRREARRAFPEVVAGP